MGHPDPRFPDPSASLRLFTVAGCLMTVAGVALPAASARIETFRHNPTLLVAVHGFTLGITAMEMGAMYQMVPVMLGARHPDRRQGRLLALLLAAGAALMLSGFYWWSKLLLITGGTAVAGAALWFVALAGGSIRPMLRDGLTPAYLAGSLASLALLVLLGLTLALNLVWNFLPAGGLTQVGAHLALGAGGWFGLAIIGLSYRLGAMFFLIPRGEPPRWAVWLAWASVAVIAALALLLLFGFSAAARPLQVLAALLGATYALDYGVRLLRRRRHGFEAALIHLMAAPVSLLLACAGLLVITMAPQGPGPWVSVALLLLPGWVGNMTFGISYRIVPFLSWHEKFALQAAHRRVPSPPQLLPHPLPVAGAVAWNLGIAGLAAGAAFGLWPLWKQGAGLLTGLGALCWGLSILRVRLYPAVKVSERSQPEG